MSNAERSARMLELARQLIETAGYDPFAPIASSGMVDRVPWQGGADAWYELGAVRSLAGLLVALVEQFHPRAITFPASSDQPSPAQCCYSLVIYPGRTTIPEE